MSEQAPAPAPQAIRIRARATATAGAAEVQLLMLHPMETGLRVDAGGEVVAAHHITVVQVFHTGRQVLSAQLGIAVAKDPLLAFRIRGASPGDRIEVVWNDNRGVRQRGETLVS